MLLFPMLSLRNNAMAREQSWKELQQKEDMMCETLLLSTSDMRTVLLDSCDELIPLSATMERAVSILSTSIINNHN